MTSNIPFANISAILFCGFHEQRLSIRGAERVRTSKKVESFLAAFLGFEFFVFGHVSADVLNPAIVILSLI
jgi:hypothetical protein